jgi:hypothetical protein
MRRFVNQDILLGNINEGQTLNRYDFVTGRPVSFVDPFGLEKEEVKPDGSKNNPITFDVLLELFDQIAGLYLAFAIPQLGCEARAHIMIKKMLEAGYSPLKAWLFNKDSNLHFKGMKKEVTWWFHVAPMLLVSIEEIRDNELISSKIQRWIIDPSLFPDGPVSLADWKRAIQNWEHSSQSKPGEPPKIYRHGMLLPFQGSYHPDMLDSNFPLYFLGLRLRGTMDEHAAETIECIKEDAWFCHF